MAQLTRRQALVDSELRAKGRALHENRYRRVAWYRRQPPVIAVSDAERAVRHLLDRMQYFDLRIQPASAAERALFSAARQLYRSESGQEEDERKRQRFIAWAREWRCQNADRLKRLNEAEHRSSSGNTNTA